MKYRIKSSTVLLSRCCVGCRDHKSRLLRASSAAHPCDRQRHNMKNALLHYRLYYLLFLLLALLLLCNVHACQNNKDQDLVE